MTPQEAQELREALRLKGAVTNKAWIKSSVHNGADDCITKAAARLLALHDAGELQGWQPIETAPVDGSDFLCWNGYEIDVVCFAWEGNDGKPEFWNRNVVFNFTHWMPLPKPPQLVSDPDKSHTCNEGCALNARHCPNHNGEQV